MNKKSKKLRNKLIIGLSGLIAFFIIMLTYKSVPDVITPDNIKKGIHYTEVNSDLYKSNKKIVAIVSLTCPHCYNFTKNFRDIQKNIEFVPVGWGRGFEQLSKIMFTAKKFSSNNKVIYELFEIYNTTQNVNLNQAFKVIEKNTKAKIQEIETYYNSEELKELVIRNQIKANKLPVTSVPTILVGDKKLKLENVKGNDNLKFLIKEITK